MYGNHGRARLYIRNEFQLICRHATSQGLWKYLLSFQDRQLGGKLTFLIYKGAVG